MDRFNAVLLVAFACAGITVFILPAWLCAMAFGVTVVLFPLSWWAVTGAAMQDGTPVIENSDIISWLELEAIALWPVVVLGGVALTAKGNATHTLRHERIHLAQQQECLVVVFYVLYVSEMVYRHVSLDPEPYFNMCFEAEAFQNEKRPSYLATRQRFAFMQYFHPVPRLRS